MSAGQALHERGTRVIPGGVNSATRYIGAPYGFRSAVGSRMTDLDGKTYVDYHAAFGATLLGYHNPYVEEAVVRAIREDALYGLGVTELEVEFAELINAVMPSVDQVIAGMSGTEATFQAVRLARAATGRPYILKFQGCFHGWHDAVARNVISPASRAYGLDPLSAGILPDALEHTLIAEFNDLASVEALFASHRDRIAAVILEPIAHNVGCLVASQPFVDGLRRITAENGSVLVFDEVITGFRHALGGFQSICNIKPDLTTFGKGLGNGYAVAGLGGSRDLMSHFAVGGGDVLLAGTFNGNPVSLAAAVATIRYLRDEDPGFYQRTAQLTQVLASGLQRMTEELDIQAQVASYGSVFALYFLPDHPTGYRDLLANDDRAYVDFHRRMTDSGFLMLPAALKRNHISAAHTAADVDDTLQAAYTVLQEMVKDGLVGA